MRAFAHGGPSCGPGLSNARFDKLSARTGARTLGDECHEDPGEGLMSEPLAPEDFPGPPGLPFVGNVRAIDLTQPIDSLMSLAREYGPIFKLTTPRGISVVVSGVDLVSEICDDARFDKVITAGLSILAEGPVDAGLFTAHTDDPMWARAHSILMAPFSMQAMRDYMPAMIDIADQLMNKWDRLNPGEDIDVPADMTRLTLDTIALCGFGYRFNSFYRDTPHPFVQAIVRVLDESQARLRQLPIQTRFKIRTQRQFEEDQAFMADLVDDLIRKRRAMGDAADNTDLLGRMITGVDKQTGLILPDENIRAQCITFLVAGHETTSGLLSFAIYFLLEHPEYLERAREEVDRVLGGTLQPTFDQVHELTYVRQVLDETLRLWPTASGFRRHAKQDTVIGDGRYAIPEDLGMMIFSPMLHRDKSIWGEDAEEFNPDHTTPERMSAIPPNAYKPFGTGQRACIGRQFALQEAVLVLGMLLQRFELIKDPTYQLRTRVTITVKPADFHIQVRRRADRPIDKAEPVAAATTQSKAGPAGSNAHHTPLAVLFGSNLGTAEGVATRLAQEATERGYDVTLGSLDDYVEQLPAKAAVIVCSSYNGLPPDNAIKFHHWVDEAESEAFKDLSYTVFGCGNTEWATTYQAVPTELDAGLEQHGAKRIHPRGAGDVRGDFDAAYRNWHDTLWKDIATTLGVDAPSETDESQPRLSITVTNRQVTNPVITSYHAQAAVVRDNHELLGANAGRSTRHLEVALPSGVQYKAGDHLGVLPRNNINLIRRVMLHFGLDAGSYLTIIPNRGSHTHLPTDEPAPLLGVLGSCVELQDPATRSDIELMARYTSDLGQRSLLEGLVGDDDASQTRFRNEVLARGRSLLDLLEDYPACAMPFEVFLDRLPPLRPRYYSISSSPLVSPQMCSVTTGVLRGPARSGVGDFNGVCSTYLESNAPNSTVFAFVREPTIAFRPPDDPQRPMIMIGAGTGLAPFRGFLQERAAQRAEGTAVATSLLFFGCRTSEDDYLYEDELRRYEADGVVKVDAVFSREGNSQRRYVQDAIVQRADEVWDLVDNQNANIYVCGNANTMAPGVRTALIQVFRMNSGTGSTIGADGNNWLAGLRADGRFLEDIWGG
jgi:cytochrome P450/NADPH-cytochrome P450 reductase